MRLTSKISPYDENWPRLFKRAAEDLSPVFGEVCLALHHVGSTAVKGLAAKAEIDVLAVVSTTGPIKDWDKALKTFGYRRGGDLSDGHHFFKRDVDGVRTHKLHVCLAGHPIVMRMLAIRDHLRGSPDDRDAYETLKLRLEYNNRSGIGEYLHGKAPFLDELYRKIQAER